MTPDGAPPKKESEAERKIRQKKEELERKAEESADNNTKGMHMFY